MTELRRVAWTGTALHLAEMFRLTKPRKGQLRCILVNNPLGWELRLLHGEELIRSEVFRESDPLLDAATEWQTRLLEKGWLRLTATEALACVCISGWRCEQHPERGWPHDTCAGPGMPCENPACDVGVTLRHQLAEKQLM